LLIEEESEKIIKRLTKAFVKQQGQVEKFLLHKAQFKGKTIICGDLNNTAYSWAYHQIKNQMNDTFIEAGNGFGKTFDLRKYPLRIDFILVDKSLEVNEHQNFTETYSDHFPVMARIGL
jgi:endonuclease/exonuclease/phosphatase family metal-dependent hydrolase